MVAVTPIDGPACPSGFNIIDKSAIFAEQAPIDWLCQSLLIAPGAPTLFAGYGYSGKSAITQALCLSIASGCALWGKYAAGTGDVLHLDYEQGARLSCERYHRLARGLGIDWRAIRHRLDLGVLPEIALSKDALCRLGEKRRFINIDSWRAAHPGVEENGSEVRRTLDAMGKASEKTGCTFSLLHHERKPQESKNGEPPDPKFMLRGSGGFFDGPQTIFVLDGRCVGRPIVRMIKDRLTGHEIEPFMLEFEDTDARRGLLIHARGVAEPAGGLGPEERFSRTVAFVLAYLADHSGESGNKVYEMMPLPKPTKTHFIAAVQDLASKGQVISKGSGPTHKLYLPENTVPFDD